MLFLMILLPLFKASYGVDGFLKYGWIVGFSAEQYKVLCHGRPIWNHDEIFRQGHALEVCPKQPRSEIHMYSVIRRHISCLLIILNGQDSVFELSQNKKSHWLQVFAQNLGTSPSDHYRVLPIQNSLGTKFHLKLAILIF